MLMSTRIAPAAGGLLTGGEERASQGLGGLQVKMELSVLSCVVRLKTNLCSRRGQRASLCCFPKRSICLSGVTSHILYK